MLSWLYLTAVFEQFHNDRPCQVVVFSGPQLSRASGFRIAYYSFLLLFENIAEYLITFDFSLTNEHFLTL